MCLPICRPFFRQRRRIIRSDGRRTNFGAADGRRSGTSGREGKFAVTYRSGGDDYRARNDRGGPVRGDAGGFAAGDGPADPYEALSPAGRLVAQAYGVVIPYDLGRRNMATLLYHARFAVRGRTFTQTEFMAATREVLEAGIVYRPGSNTGLSAEPAWAPRLTIAAFEEGNL